MICDFGKALHNSVRGQFPNSVLNGRLFYWKHAIRRKMIEFKIEKEQIKLAMTESVLDILTVIPRDQILTKGIDYVREIIDAVCKTKQDTRKWDIFWKSTSRSIVAQVMILSKPGIFATNMKSINLYKTERTTR